MGRLAECRDCRPACYARVNDNKCIALANAEFFDEKGQRRLCPFYVPFEEARAERIKLDGMEMYKYMVEEGFYYDPEVKEK